MQVSVAMATYNGERYLREQLASLARQTTAPAELVVSDDGSSDDTCGIIEDFRRHSPFPVRILSGPRLGYVGNFFRAVKACRGDAIALCDQDDIWRPEKIAVCVSHFDKNVTLVLHSAQVIDASGNLLNKRAPAIGKTREIPQGVFDDGPLRSFPLGFSLIIRRSVTEATLKVLSSYPEVLRHYFGHEMPFYWMAKARGNSVYLSNDLVFYRRHGANASAGQALKNKKIAKGLYNGAAAYREFGRHAEYQAELLVLLTGTDPDTDRTLHMWAHARRRLSQNLFRRAEIYEQTGVWAKGLLLTELLKARGYQSRKQGGLGWTSLIKDLTHIVPGRAL
ncbi:MAG: glycosyltransferase [Firmicutes bacterium]|jgi:glycosyltransferase involved in cell wall biosynthesis|uniref:Glycosyltransferase 2-like domain-containing protein n=1 Tax=Sulfobacillus benefaciens TaxID=453960 RepID=A0A2T2XA64_9FIRM|nr:glycosyltransferase [Bacillota bacterium]MCL5015345.1 glycosyltransferase [Bacillota bacterium]PSR31336.1 MAG: hypothetical protein C7B43_02925 [Sulfobacillus benefaciens]